MGFQENYKREMQDIKRDKALDQNILDAVEDGMESVVAGSAFVKSNFAEPNAGQSEGMRKYPAETLVYKKKRTAGKWAAAAAFVCGILLIVNFPSVTSYADVVIGNFRLIAGGRQMQLSEMTPVEIDLEKHMAYEKTELSQTPYGDNYWCNYETQELLRENTGLIISNSDELKVHNTMVIIDTTQRTGHLSMKVILDGKKYGMNGMFVIDGFDQDKEYGYGERSAPYYVYEYADGKKAYFVKDRDYEDLQKVYFSEKGIMYQLFVEKSEEGKKAGERIVDAMAK